jgi:hypothetical protein
MLLLVVMGSQSRKDLYRVSLDKRVLFSNLFSLQLQQQRLLTPLMNRKEMNLTCSSSNKKRFMSLKISYLNNQVTKDLNHLVIPKLNKYYNNKQIRPYIKVLDRLCLLR